MSEYTIFSKRLKAQLEKNKISQRELAEKTGITEVTISRYISAQRIPKATEIVKIANILNCSCDYLLGNENKREISLSTAIWYLEMNRPFEESEWQKTIDISIRALKLQMGMKKYCDSNDCTDCRIDGICTKTFMLDELQ